MASDNLEIFALQLSVLNGAVHALLASQRSDRVYALLERTLQHYEASVQASPVSEAALSTLADLNRSLLAAARPLR